MQHRYFGLRFLRTSLALVFTSFVFTTSLSAQVLVAGTDFTPRADKLGEKFVSLDQVEQYGVLKGKLSTNLPLYKDVSTAFGSKMQYSIVNNPTTIDESRFKDIKEYIFVVPGIYTYNPLFNYTLEGLLPNSIASVTVSYCSIIDTLKTKSDTSYKCRGTMAGFTTFPTTNGNTRLETQISTCTTSTFSITVSDRGQLVVGFSSIYGSPCMAVGICKIEIKGQLALNAEALPSEELCVKETVKLQPTKTYKGNYTWQVFDANGWTTIGTGIEQRYETSKVGYHRFRYMFIPEGTLAPIVSEELLVKVSACCTGPNGATTSRQTIFHENFGRLDLADSGRTYYVWDYETDPRHPKEVKKTTTTPFRWPIVPAPVGATFSGGGSIEDGYYTTAAYLTAYTNYNGYKGAKLEWGNVLPNSTYEIAYDHSGKIDGGVLLLNNAFQSQGSVIYQRSFTNLCSRYGKTVYFECYITTFTGSGDGVDLTVRLIQGKDTVKLDGSACSGYSCGDYNKKWVRIAGEIELHGDSFSMGIINNAPNSWNKNGNDLALDDIRLMACAPPQAEVFFDKGFTAQSDTVCKEDILLSTSVSDNLKQFFGGSPYYVFQYSKTPTDYTSWKNLGMPSNKESILVPSSSAAFANTAHGDKVYFRTLITTDAAFTDFSYFQLPATYASYEDPCRNYSITSPIVVTVNKSPDCDRITGVEETEATTVAYLYPNPTKELLQFSPSVKSYRVHSSLGIVQAQGEASSISVASLPAGVYQVALTLHNGQVVWQQLVKE